MDKKDVQVTLSGKPDRARKGFGVVLTLAGTVQGDPTFSIRSRDGVPAFSCTLDCGETFAVRSVDGAPLDAPQTVHVLTDPYERQSKVAFLNDQPGYLDRAGAAFYSETCLIPPGFLPSGESSTQALSQIGVARTRYNLSALAFPVSLRLVGYGGIAQAMAEALVAGSEIAVHAYGRTLCTGKKRPRRFEAVAIYVQFLQKIAWPDGGADFITPRTSTLPGRLGPSAAITGVVVDPPNFIPAQNGRTDFIAIVVSAAWDRHFDALVTLLAVGEQARILAEQVKQYDVVQANCAVHLQRSKRRPVVRFVIRELAVLGCREAVGDIQTWWQ
ncbi:MAG: hypothetical protein JXB47_01035 [Anaerolineae bacterium]|nr:hypothetical protein [Anaerolineae bacterium]